MSKGKLFVISGASGVGKSTVLKEVMAARKDLLFSVSATTRQPRPDEREGVSYYFLSRERFREMIDNNEFMEYDEHNDTLYGTPRGQLEEKLSRANVILDVEPNGAFAVKRERPDAKLIFIMPPSEAELERRLRERNDTPPDQIRMRLDRARWEMEQRFGYDHVVVNTQVDTCAREILHIIAQAADEE